MNNKIPDTLILNIVNGVFVHNIEAIEKMGFKLSDVTQRLFEYITISRDVYFNRDIPSDQWRSDVISKGYSPEVIIAIINTQRRK